MTSGYPITQEEMLYDQVWTRDIDNCFIDLLLQAHSVGLFVAGKINKGAIEFCCDVLNIEHETAFSYGYGRTKLEFLEKRYRVFRWMLRKHGMRYCLETGIMTAPLPIWEDIFEREPFSVAYQDVGDPRWTDLRLLFAGLFDVPDGAENLVDLTKSENDAGTPELPIVTMPLVDTTPTGHLAAKKRLFNDCSESSVNQSVGSASSNNIINDTGTSPTVKIRQIIARARNPNSPCKGSNVVAPP